MTLSELYPVNLIERYKGTATEAQAVEYASDRLNFSSDTLNLRAGDTVSFVGGHDLEFLYTTKVIGVDSNDNVYVLWDCYWLPLNVTQRKLKKLN